MKTAVEKLTEPENPGKEAGSATPELTSNQKMILRSSEAIKRNPNEPARRKPNWSSSGHFITDVRGQKWALPEMEVEFWPGINEDGKVEVLVRESLGDEFDDLREKLRESKGTDTLRVMFQAAAYLLKVNYNLEDDDLVSILRGRPTEERFKGNQQAIIDSVYGLPPKPMAVGSTPPLEPTASTDE